MLKRKLTSDETGILFFLAAFLFGAAFRLMPPYLAGFPINDGGLFYNMMEAVRQNHYALPEFVRYNGLEIPFAYPPLAFYLAGFLADILGKPLMDMVLWFPAFTLIAIIPAVYYLANIILKSRLQAGLAVLMYALLPRSVTWLIMGGGVTRALGQLFLIFAVANIYLMFRGLQQLPLLETRKSGDFRVHLTLSILFSALVCLTHPEAALHTIAIAFILFLFYGRNKRGLILSALVILGTLILTSPWWILILARFGLDPFISAASTGLHGLGYLVVLFAPFTGEPYMTIIALFAILGAATQLAKREVLLPVLFAAPFFIEPRSAANVSIIFMALLAALAWSDLILPALARIENPQLTKFLQSRAEKILFFYLVFCLIIGMQMFTLNFREARVSPEEREAFAWIEENTPADSRFIIITGKTDLFADPTNEWFPVLSQRVSLTTIQGWEWMGRGGFAQRVPLMQDLQRCGDLTCVESAAAKADFDFTHLIVPAHLAHELKPSAAYYLAYDKNGVAVFGRK